MSLHIHIAHTGRSLVFSDPNARLDSLRSWIERNAGLPSNRQILMTARGKNVKNLSNETEIFVYDKQYLSLDSKPPPPRTEEIPHLPEPPSSLSDDNTLKSWQELFMSRRSWTLELVDVVRKGADTAEDSSIETEVIARSIRAALDNLRSYVSNMQQKFEATQQWAQECLQEHTDVLSDWKGSANVLAELPVREDVANILRRSPKSNNARNPTEPIATLADLADTNVLEQAASSLTRSSKVFEEQLQDLQTKMAKLQKDSREAGRHEVQEQPIDTAALVDEAETLAKRINSDYEEILKLPDETKSMTVASKKANTHTRDFLPALQTIMADLQHALQVSQNARNDAAEKCYETLQEISTIQSRLGTIQSAISGLEFHDDESLQNLSCVFQLPTVYGSTLVEAIRRSEWTERMSSEVDSLHDDITQQTEEEQRRRRKWATSYGEFLNQDLNTNDALIDLKASKPRNVWPFVSRDEIFSFIEDLRALGIDDAVQTIAQRLKDLDAPSRKPRPKAFKNGSVHDLAQSGTLRNGDEVRTLQDDKVRLEDRLRASDSRIRKLEDLLHRQSQFSRPSSGMFVPGPVSDFERHSPSPSPFTKQDDMSRRSSVSLRRLSGAQDEKVLVQRIATLESQIQKLQEEAHAERRSSTESRDKMQEAESVKRDLMANFEAQRQEFDDERQILEDDNHKLKIRLEELEDELDRVLGSRDHQKMTQEQKINSLRQEIEKLQKTSTEELELEQRKNETLSKDLSGQRERIVSLERQLHQQREDRTAAQTQNMTLANQLRSLEEQQQEFINSLQSTHVNLSPAGSPPDDLLRLVNALEILSEGAAIHTRGLDDSLQLAMAENKSLEAKVAHAESQMKILNDKITSAEAKSVSLGESLELERTKSSAVRAELADEQNELRNLRAKFAVGETGPDALRERLAAEEKKVVDLLEQKVENESTIQTLKHEIENVKRSADQAESEQQALRKHFDSRGEKARQLSERLFQHNDRVIRMLEQFGYSIIRQDDTIVVQRASKVNASTTLSGLEQSSSMRRTISGSLPGQHYSDPSDLEALYWTTDTEAQAEGDKYQSFMTALQRLDLDATIDLITKRYKDVENLAKKYQKDSRAYREKAHRLQSEANDKIAYRAFKEGDLALFLPTRNQATRPWAAFNIGAPHYFLREQDAHKLQARDWLVARISKVEERVVDLSRPLSSGGRGAASMTAEASDAASSRSIDDENPFELSDGLRWYMIDASEEKPGAPGTPSVGKSTVISSNIEVKGHMGRKEKGGTSTSGNAAMVTKTLNKSLDSRRSSSGSKKSGSIKMKGEGSSVKDMAAPLAPITSESGVPNDEIEVRPSSSDALPGQAAREDASVFDVNDNPSPDRSGRVHTTSNADRVSQNPSRTASPMKPRSNASPVKPGPSPAKGKPWDKLFSVEYRS